MRWNRIYDSMNFLSWMFKAAVLSVSILQIFPSNAFAVADMRAVAVAAVRAVSSRPRMRAVSIQHSAISGQPDFVWLKADR